MSGSDSHRIPPNRVALSLVLLLIAWLVFSFYPRDKTPPPAAPLPVVESKLRAVGLEDNPDWEGLPEFFAVWADGLSWTDNRTRFGYWNPGTSSYSYFFEATRGQENYHFRAIPKKEFSKGVYYVGEDEKEITEEVPELKLHSPTHPFVFEYDPVIIGPGPHVDVRPQLNAPVIPEEKHEVKVDLAPVTPVPKS